MAEKSIEQQASDTATAFVENRISYEEAMAELVLLGSSREDAARELESLRTIDVGSWSD